MFEIDDSIIFINNNKEEFGKIKEIRNDKDILKIQLFTNKENLKIKKNEKSNLLNNELFLTSDYCEIKKIDIKKKLNLEILENFTEKYYEEDKYFCRFKTINDNTNIIRINELDNDNNNFINIGKRENSILIDDEDIENLINNQKKLFENKKTIKREIIKINNDKMNNENSLKTDKEIFIEIGLKKFKNYFNKPNFTSESEKIRYNIRYKFMEIFLKIYLELKDNKNIEFEQYHSKINDIYKFLSEKVIDLEVILFNLNNKENKNINDYTKKSRTIILSMKQNKNNKWRKKIYYSKISYKDLYFLDEDKLNEDIVDKKILKSKNEYMSSRLIKNDEKFITKNHKGDIEILIENENEKLDNIDNNKIQNIINEKENINIKKKFMNKNKDIKIKSIDNNEKYDPEKLLNEYKNLSEGELRIKLENINLDN